MVGGQLHHNSQKTTTPHFIHIDYSCSYNIYILTVNSISWVRLDRPSIDVSRLWFNYIKHRAENATTQRHMHQFWLTKHLPLKQSTVSDWTGDRLKLIDYDSTFSNGKNNNSKLHTSILVHTKHIPLTVSVVSDWPGYRLMSSDCHPATSGTTAEKHNKQRHINSFSHKTYTVKCVTRVRVARSTIDVIRLQSNY